MEGGGKVKKARPRKKPYVKKQKDIISPIDNTITPGNSGEVTAGAATDDMSGEKATDKKSSDMFTIN